MSANRRSPDQAGAWNRNHPKILTRGRITFPDASSVPAPAHTRQQAAANLPAGLGPRTAKETLCQERVTSAIEQQHAPCLAASCCEDVQCVRLLSCVTSHLCQKGRTDPQAWDALRSEEHTSELQSLRHL